MRRLLAQLPYKVWEEAAQIVGAFLGLETGDRFLLEDGSRIKLEE